MSDPSLVILLTILLLIVAAGIIVFVLIYQKKQLQHLSERKQLKADYEKEILESRLEIQEQTMKSISQEVHDNIGQVLSVAKLNLTMVNVDESGEMIQEKINNVSELLRQAIQDLRDLSKSLHSDVIAEKGLLKAIENEVAVLKKTEAYSITLNVEGDYYHLPEQKELILFRMFQEMINNIIKHAKATDAELALDYNQTGLNITIGDNGTGFIFPDNTQSNKTGMAGLKNMETRTKMIGGKMQLESIIDKGTILSFSFPY